MNKTDLTVRETHFEFGKNWQAFLSGVTEAHIEEAVRGMQRLFPCGELQGKRFLDIGSGSGLHMLAALRLGVVQATGMDIDENSVMASRQCLARYAAGGDWSVHQASVFDLEPEMQGQYDVVYSWGVLHHTGAMWPAVAKAAALVADGGMLAVALYGKTPFCGLWRIEKRLYSHIRHLHNIQFVGCTRALRSPVELRA